MNFLPVVLNVIDTVVGPVAEIDPDTMDAIQQEHELTGLKVRQNYIAKAYGRGWYAMRSHTCETEGFASIADALDWVTEEE